MNDKTKCSFVLYGVTTKSIPKIQTLIFEGIRAMMESEYISNEIINKYIDDSPMEDCGGPHEFNEIMKILDNPNHPEHNDVTR